MKSAQKTLALWVFGVILAVFLFQAYENRHERTINGFNYARFSEAIKADEIAEVTFRPDTGEIIGDVKPEYEKKFEGRHFSIVGNTGDEGYKFVVSHGLTPNYEKGESGGLIQSLLVNWLPVLLIVGMFFFLMRQMQMGGGKAMSFGKSRARLLNESKNRVTFKEVAGVEEAKEDLQEIVQFLKDPKKFTK